jgi:hypothetical protein
VNDKPNELEQLDHPSTALELELAYTYEAVQELEQVSETHYQAYQDKPFMSENPLFLN